MSNLRTPFRRQFRVVALLSVLALAACGEKQAPAQGGGMKVPVSVIQVQPEPTTVYVDLPGRVEAIKDAQIRARVTGIVNEINFEQGSDVKQGQLLFTIDPAPYRAARDQAAAQLKRAQADVRSARLLADRYSKLIKANAISRQEYDNAIAVAGQGDAAVAAAQATLQSADIDLGYTKVVSPIDGRIGKSLVTEGALVSASSATQLATVQQLDKVYVDITRSTTQLAELREALESGVLVQSADGNAAVRVLKSDGTLYPQVGKLLFSGVSVDPTTGQVSLRAEFPNDAQLLLPGMYVRVRLEQGVDEKALVVPEQAIQRGADGSTTLMLLKDDKAVPVPIVTGARVEGKVIINNGLNPGDTVIVAGFQKIGPGAPVQGIPWQDKPAANGPGAAANGQPAGPTSGQDGAPANAQQKAPADGQSSSAAAAG
jgi:membrane fusion protein (multidrug efflux system)